MFQNMKFQRSFPKEYFGTGENVMNYSLGLCFSEVFIVNISVIDLYLANHPCSGSTLTLAGVFYHDGDIAQPPRQ